MMHLEERVRQDLPLSRTAGDGLFERCQRGGEITFSNGEAGFGVYAYPVKYAPKLRPYYRQGENGKDGEDRSIFHLRLRHGYVIDLTGHAVMESLLRFARSRFQRNRAELTRYQVPSVDANNIQRFGSTIEDFVRTSYPDAAGYTVNHRFGNAMPRGKQTVITMLDRFEIERIA